MPEAPPKAGYYTPMLHVKSIEDSIRFYELLGFKTIDTDRCQPLGWARMHCEGGALMFLRADEEPMEPEKQAVIFVMYTSDLAALREHLVANGLKPSAIRHPEYMPSGEMSLADPDGYGVFINHWGEKEHSAWLERIGASPAA